MTRPLQSTYDTLKTAAQHRTPDIHIQDVHPLGDRCYKVVASVENCGSEREFAEAVRVETAGAAHLISGSTVRGGRIVVGVIRSNPRSRPMSDAFTMLTACTASDAGGNIWDVVNDGAGKRLVREEADDLETILRDRMAHRRVVANPLEGGGLTTASFDNCDLVRYVNPARATVNCALAFHVDGELRGVTVGGKVRRLTVPAVMQAVPARAVHPDLHRLQREVAGTDLTGPELEKAIQFLGKCGILSEEMAERMRSLSSTPAGGVAA